MRPVLLEMDGFASFRQRTTVDFTDIDYFALVGPTGAGKSTVIDALTFALYGQVARWDDAGAVAPALAPTVNRGTVKLVFDTHGQRYIAIRELRRAGNGQVSVKTARLERLDDPTALGGPEDTTTVLGDGRGAKAAAEELLGLDFNQFTKCVALPQGDFADLLHAAGMDRDKILTKLLGIDIYVRLGKSANSRASHLITKAETLRAAIDSSFDTSDEALQLATAKYTQLTDLESTLKTGLVRLTELRGGRATAAERQSGLSAAVTALTAVRTPTGLLDLDAEHTAIRADLAAALPVAAAAEVADSAARSGVSAHMPRATLERLADQHRERNRLNIDLPRLAETAITAEATRTTAESIRRGADAEHANATEAVKLAETKATTAAEAMAGAISQLKLLDSVTTPKELTNLLRELVQARLASTAVGDQVAAAREAVGTARAARGKGPDPVLLERASTSIAYLKSCSGDAHAAVTALCTAHAAVSPATATAAVAASVLAGAEATARVLADRRVAADLRAHLHVGGVCPVCDQHITDVPPPLDSSDTTAAEQGLAEARTSAADATGDLAGVTATLAGDVRTAASRLTTLAKAHLITVAALSAASLTTEVLAVSDDNLDDVTASTSADDLSARTDRVFTTLAALNTALTTCSDVTEAALTERAALENALADMEGLLNKAEIALAAEGTRIAKLTRQEQDARTQLSSVRDPLVALGAPAVDDSDLPAAWSQLTEWALVEAKAGRTSLSGLEKVAKNATKSASVAQGALASAAIVRAEAHTAYDSAVKALADANAAFTTATTRVAELDGLLADQPALVAVLAHLEELLRLEEAAADAAGKLAAARAERDSAQTALAALEEKLTDARAALASARDPLVAHGAPALPDNLGLAEAWMMLTDWATSKLVEHRAALVTANTNLETIISEHAAAEQKLQTQLAAADVIDVTGGPDSPVETWAPAALAATIAKANAGVQAIKSERDRAADLERQIAEAQNQARVARLLGELLSINKFPRWINRSALEVLVTAASTTLMELSGGQFELSLNDASNFTVIDHNDADAERIVKTLSGGETFQASLALALALSTHLGALAAEGAAQVEAIFIDEGFGTLDEQTLDTVAGTLETLASSAGRMVGVITHVPALAARVPVRFNVTRDRRGSSIERVQA